MKRRELMYIDRIYSAGLNGQILVWDSASKAQVQTLLVDFGDEEDDDKKEILRQICCRNNVLLCCTFLLNYVFIHFESIFMTTVDVNNDAIQTK